MIQFHLSTTALEHNPSSSCPIQRKQQDKEIGVLLPLSSHKILLNLYYESLNCVFAVLYMCMGRFTQFLFSLFFFTSALSLRFHWLLRQNGSQWQLMVSRQISGSCNHQLTSGNISVKQFCLKSEELKSHISNNTTENYFDKIVIVKEIKYVLQKHIVLS